MAFSFGQPAAASSGPATTSTPSFSFGAPQQQQQQQQPQQQGASGSLGFSFGKPAQAGANTPVQGPQSSIFGAPGTSNQQQQQQQQQTQPSSSLFGQGQQQQAGQPSSSFGQPQAASTSLFGQQQQQPAQGQQATSSLFGKPFGQQQQPQNTGNQPLTIGSLGSTAPYNQGSRIGLFGNQGGTGAQGQLNAQNTPDKRLGVPVNDRLEAIRAAWDVQNIQTCQFLYYFYNSISDAPGQGEAALANPNYGRRQDAIGPRHDALWLQTLRENPDRSRLVPFLAVGYPDLKTRVDLQQGETSRQSSKLAELQKRLDELTSKHSMSNSVRISAISRKQTSLHQRLISVAKRIHLLIPALRGHSITAREEQLKNLLHACEMELASISMPSDGRAIGSVGLGGQTPSEDASAVVQHRLRGRINELWALLGTVKARREASSMAGDRDRLQWAVVDEGAMEDVVKILSAQQQGLDHLCTTLHGDTRSLDTIVKGLEGVELIGTK